LVYVIPSKGFFDNRTIGPVVRKLKPDDVYALGGVDGVWIVANFPFTSQAKALARKSRIRLVDGDDLREDLKP
jgi:hypothetical protein